MAEYDPHCRLCGRSPSQGLPPTSQDDPQLDLGNPWTFLRSPIYVKLPGGGETQVAHACRACYFTAKYLRSAQPVPFAIYYEQIDASGQLDWKDCAMCGDLAYSTTAWCWRCAGAMQRPSAKERYAEERVRVDEKMRRDFAFAMYTAHNPRGSEQEFERQWEAMGRRLPAPCFPSRGDPWETALWAADHGRINANSVGALQVLPDSVWSSHIEYLPQNTYVEAPYTRNAEKGSFKIHGFGA